MCEQHDYFTQKSYFPTKSSTVYCSKFDESFWKKKINFLTKDLTFLTLILNISQLVAKPLALNPFFHVNCRCNYSAIHFIEFLYQKTLVSCTHPDFENVTTISLHSKLQSHIFCHFKFPANFNEIAIKFQQNFHPTPPTLTACNLPQNKKNLHKQCHSLLE